MNFIQSYGERMLTGITQWGFLLFAGIMLTLLILSYTFMARIEKERCECAMISYYTTLRRLMMFLIVYHVILLLLALAMRLKWLSVPRSPALLRTFGTILWMAGLVDLVFVILSAVYLSRLYKLACKCSDNGYKTVYMVYILFRLAVIGLSIFIALFALLMLLIVLASMSKR